MRAEARGGGLRGVARWRSALAASRGPLREGGVAAGRDAVAVGRLDARGRRCGDGLAHVHVVNRAGCRPLQQPVVDAVAVEAVAAREQHPELVAVLEVHEAHAAGLLHAGRRGPGLLGSRGRAEGLSGEDLEPFAVQRRGLDVFVEPAQELVVLGTDLASLECLQRTVGLCINSELCRHDQIAVEARFQHQAHGATECSPRVVAVCRARIEKK
mmetsp:Transcript_71398/g.202534  ORF Transcript_71398/g.202534 Transcript_71398/m.202534 type:complete len:213 (-) Transcript_71398:728-1366(-)